MPSCGFTLQSSAVGKFVVDLGFGTTQRFASVTVVGSGAGPVVAAIDNSGTNQITVSLWHAEDGDPMNQDFVLFVY